MNKDNVITYSELEIFFIATCKGLSKLLACPTPRRARLAEVATTLFYKYDMDKSQSLELEEYHCCSSITG